MAFQDFDYLSERRKTERSRKMKKRIMIGVFSSLLLAAVVAAGVIAVVRTGHSGESTKTNAEPAPTHPAKQISHSEKAIKMVCSSTDYQETCKNTLSKAVKGDKAQPNELIKLAIKATSDEIVSALNKTEKFKFQSEEEKGAFEDCKTLLNDAIEELGLSISSVTTDMKRLSSMSGELNNWLSAVVSYQQTCIDGFPEGKLKTDVEKALKTADELTSNSLAIISQLSTFLSSLAAGANRHLLGTDGLPSWMNSEERRMLKGAPAKDKLTPTVTVAKDGSGQFKTINDALKAMPAKYEGRYIIYVKEGIYDETVVLDKEKVNVTIYGDGSQKSIVTGNKNFVDGVRTFQTATFAVEADGFMAQAMGFRNTAGPEKHQAVAVRVKGDRAIFLNCRFEGYQDTLYVQTHRQYYRSCVISGTVDFIFGDAAVVFQNCLIFVRKPLDNQQNIVTAQGRYERHENTGIVLQSCKIQPDPALVPVKKTIKSYLGRPWKEFSRTVVMESEIDDLIQPEGWMPWAGDFALKTLYYAEYNNKGPGADVAKRVNWPGYKKSFKKADAESFTIGKFLEGDWIKAADVPVHFGLN